MEQFRNNHLSKRGPHTSWIITSEKLWYLFLVVVSVVFGFLLLVVPRPEIVPALAIALIVGLTFFFNPYLGILTYVILTYMRFEETIPALGNLHLTRLLTVTLIIVWAIRAAITKSALYLQEKGLLLLYLFYLIMVFSIPFSFWPSYSFNVFVEMLKILVFVILFIHLIDSQKKLKIFFWVFLVVNCYLAFSAVKNFMLLGQTAVSARVGGTGGFLGDANDFALALSVALPFSFYLFLSERKKLLKFIYLTFCSILTLGIVSTSSRGGFITLVFLMFYFVLKSKRKLLGVFSILLIFLLIFLFAPQEYWQRQMTITSYEQDESAMGRIDAWKAGIRMFADRPLLGVGLGAYETAFGVKYGGKEGSWFSAHNAYVQTGAELGFLGILVYLGLMFYIYSQANRLAKSIQEGNYLKTISQGLVGALLAYAVGSFFLSVGHYPHLYFLLGVAIVIKILNIEKGA
jgi:putative inorganic carbon (HCO3(-)) transporter